MDDLTTALDAARSGRARAICGCLLCSPVSGYACAVAQRITAALLEAEREHEATRQGLAEAMVKVDQLERGTAAREWKVFDQYRDRVRPALEASRVALEFATNLPRPFGNEKFKQMDSALELIQRAL